MTTTIFSRENLRACLDSLALLAHEKKRSHLVAKMTGVSATHFANLVYWGIHRHLARYDPTIRSSAFWLDDSLPNISARIHAHAEFILDRVSFVNSALDASAKWLPVSLEEKACAKFGVDLPLPAHLLSQLTQMKLLVVGDFVKVSLFLLQAVGVSEDDVRLLDGYLGEYGISPSFYLCYRAQTRALCGATFEIPETRLPVSRAAACVLEAGGIVTIDDLLEVASTRFRNVPNMHGAIRKEVAAAILNLQQQEV